MRWPKRPGTPRGLRARMTGAGFGGVHRQTPSQVDRVMADIAARYTESTGITPDLFSVVPSDGAAVIAGR